MSEKIFTLEEVNRLLPQLEATLIEIQKLRAFLLSLDKEVRASRECAKYNGGSAYGSHYIDALKQLSGKVEQINAMGVLLKDIERGLCDFPAVMDGRLVYLCWELGESEVQWWHEINAGYQGRQRIGGTGH